MSLSTLTEARDIPLNASTYVVSSHVRIVVEITGFMLSGLFCIEDMQQLRGNRHQPIQNNHG